MKMAEAKEEEVALVVGNMGIEEFFSALLVVMERAQEKHKTTGEAKLMDLGIGEFTKLMLDQLKSRALSTASAETSAAERVLTDWQGLMTVDAITQPFRIKVVGDVDQFATELRSAFAAGFKGEFVVAVAVTNAPNTYAPRKS